MWARVRQGVQRAVVSRGIRDEVSTRTVGIGRTCRAPLVSIGIAQRGTPACGVRWAGGAAPRVGGIGTTVGGSGGAAGRGTL